MTIKVKDGQTLYDLAVQYYGDITGFWWLLEDNDLTVESEILPGDELLIRDEFIKDKALYFRSTGKEVNNSDTFRFSEKSPLSVRVLQIKSELSGGDGFIRVEVTGGKTPYFYRWSNGSTSKDLLNASAGSYSLTVEDSKGKQVFLNVSIGTDNTGNWLAERLSGEDILTASGDKIVLNV